MNSSELRWIQVKPNQSSECSKWRESQSKWSQLSPSEFNWSQCIFILSNPNEIKWAQVGSIWAHLNSFGYLTWIHFDSHGLTWIDLDSLGLTWSTWIDLGSLEFISINRININSYIYIYILFDIFFLCGLTLIHMHSLGLIWSHMDWLGPLGSTWAHLNSFG